MNRRVGSRSDTNCLLDGYGVIVFKCTLAVLQDYQPRRTQRPRSPPRRTAFSRTCCTRRSTRDCCAAARGSSCATFGSSTSGRTCNEAGGISHGSASLDAAAHFSAPDSYVGAAEACDGDEARQSAGASYPRACCRRRRRPSALPSPPYRLGDAATRATAPGGATAPSAAAAAAVLANSRVETAAYPGRVVVVKPRLLTTTSANGRRWEVYAQPSPPIKPYRCRAPCSPWAALAGAAAASRLADHAPPGPAARGGGRARPRFRTA